MKQYNIFSNYDDKHELCGIIHTEIRNCKEYYIVEVIGDPDRWDFPVDLLGIHRNWSKESQFGITRWLESRVIPKNRDFLDEILLAHNLDHWDLDELLKLNKGRVSDDKFTIEIVEA